MDLLIFAIIMLSDGLTDEQWISRCFDLAKRGIGQVSPNPPVGAVLVHNGRILSEGYHAYYGGPHAEVDVLKNVPDHLRHLIPDATLYVSLEPCCIYGKTPPCTDLIVKEKIKDVRVSILDPNPQIAGKGISILRSNGVNVTQGILEEEGIDLIRAFKTNILQHRPYIILKWAQSHDLFIGKNDVRVMISHPYTSAWTHGLRASADAIIVGARTVLTDNPKLTTRDAPGESPHRVIYDPNGNLKMDHHVFNRDGRKVFYFSMKEINHISADHIFKYILNEVESHATQISQVLFSHQIGILLVEGGSYLLNLFIQENLWDEAWVIRSEVMLNDGVKAPAIKGKLIEEISSATDTIVGVKNVQY